jgi:hypothetical protein
MIGARRSAKEIREGGGSNMDGAHLTGHFFPPRVGHMSHGACGGRGRGRAILRLNAIIFLCK